MARPKKQTVDYFPHIVSSGKTMYILESRFGNDGYALWFKVLELLGTSDGHVYNCRNSANWQFLLAKTNQSEERAREMLTLLAELDAIDTELWSINVIWSQNFVDNIADVYKNRKAKAPTKPSLDSFYEQKPIQPDVSTSKNPAEESNEGVSTDENPQSKVKETKVKESNVVVEGGDFSPEEFNALQDFETLWLFPNQFQLQDLNDLIDQHGQELTSAAIRLAGTKDVVKGKAINFLKAVLKEWAENHVTNSEQVAAYQAKRDQKQKKQYSNPTARTESMPDWADEENKGEEIDYEKQEEFRKRLERIRSRKKLKQEG